MEKLLKNENTAGTRPRVDQYRNLRLAILFLATTLIVTRILQAEHLFIPRGIADHILGRRVNDSFLIIGYLLLLFRCVSMRDWRDLYAVAATGIGGLILVQAIKFGSTAMFPHAAFLRRPSTGGGGFPSGHAQASFMLAYMIGARYPKLAIPAYFVAAIITWSRVPYEHFFYQIVAGGIVGLAVAVAVESIFERKPVPGNVTRNA
jgi:membrane-associated phospholipid phosphatase